MTDFDVLKQLEIDLFIDIIMDLCETFKTKEKIKEILLKEKTEDELQKLNSIAQSKGYPLSLDFKQ